MNHMTDWADLLKRTHMAQRAALEPAAVSAGLRERILRARAEQLAAPLTVRHESDAAHAFAILRCGNDRYAIAIRELVEVITEPKIAVVPHAPAFVAGLIQVRGEICPVYRLKALLGQDGAGQETPPVVVLAAAASDFGIGVDAVEDIRQVPPESRAPAAVGHGYAGWMTEDFIPCLTAETLLPEQN
jgi:chemotaxis signal transduction protein